MLETQPIKSLTTEEQLKLQYETLGHESGRDFTEIRIVDEKRQLFCRTLQDFTSQSILETKKQVGCYVGINPRGLDDGSGKAVNRVTCICIDIDPVRPKGQASTEAQHEAAINKAWEVANDLRYNSVVVSSGSGSHVYIPIEPISVVNSEQLTESLKAWFYEIRDKYQTKELKFDSIFDLARIIRLWGSWNGKSNRECKVLGGSYLSTKQRNKIEFSQETIKVKANVQTTNYEQRFEKLLAINPTIRNIISNVAGYPSPSESDFAFVGFLSRSGFSVEEILLLARRNPYGNQDIDERKVRLIVGKVSGESTLVKPEGASKGYFAGLSARSEGLKSGIKELDRITGGFRNGLVYLFAARPGTGKTSLITQAAVALSEAGSLGLMFPTECGSTPIFDKVISQRTGVNLIKFQTGGFTSDDLKKIEDAQGWFNKLQLIVVEEFALTLGRIELEVRRTQPNFVVIDFFQAMKFGTINKTSEQEEVFRGIHKIATENNIPVMVTSQLNRASVGEAIDLSKIKGSGAQEELADFVLALWAINKQESPRGIMGSCLKNKYGLMTDIRLRLDTATGKFLNENEAQ